VSADVLGPGWLSAVPVMFGSAARSIENHRQRVVGDPASLSGTAHGWRAEAVTLDENWQSLRASARRELGGWSGSAADSYSARRRTWEGEVSAIAESLRFAATGLDSAATVLHSAQREANRAVLAFAAEVSRLYAVARCVPAPGRAGAVETLVAQGNDLAGRTLRLVAAQEQRVDGVLASLPRSFLLGPSAPWRAGIMQVADLMDSQTMGAAVTVAGVRVRRGTGISVSRDSRGRTTVTITDDYGLGGKWAGGAKVDLNQLAPADQGMLRRAYAEAEAGGSARYSLRYHFDTAAEAQQFIDSMQPANPWETVVAAARDAVGGPLGRAAAHRAADEGTITLGLNGKANADVGLGPVAGASGVISGERGRSLMWKSSGQYSWIDHLSGEAKANVQALAATAIAGSAGSAATRVDYDRDGRPLRYVVQSTTTGDYTYLGGTNNTYIGGTPPIDQLPKGVHGKLDAERAMEQVVSYSLDLTESRNYEAYQKSQGASSGGEDLADRVRRDAVTTVQTYAVHRSAAEVSADVGLGPATFGIKGGPSGLQREIVDAYYIPSGESGGGPREELVPRPLPRDPMIRNTRMDVISDPSAPRG
jgi:uncharacterized protein YukE